MNIYFFTRYNKLGASSRYRFYNYLKYFKNDHKVQVFPFFSDIYLRNKYNKKNNLLRIVFSFFKRIYFLIKINKDSVLIIEKELFPYLPAFIEFYFLKNKKYVLDFDDAIYLNYKSKFYKYFFLYNKIEKLAKHANAIIVGSNALNAYLKSFNSNISIIPTVVDFNNYKKVSVSKFVKISIVWIGTETNSKYFLDILPILKELKSAHDVNIICIGVKIRDKDVISFSWSSKEEIKLLKKSHIGIMPLFNDEWSKAKCGFKILQYMASSLPVVASDIGQNKLIITEDTGYLVKKREDWYEKIKILIEKKNHRELLGKNGYNKIVLHYNYEKNFSKIYKLIQNII